MGRELRIENGEEWRVENGEWRNYELIETALENLNNKNYLLNSPLGGARGATMES